VSRAAATLVDLITETMEEGPDADWVSICAGVAGAGRTQAQEQITDALRRALSHPERTVHVEVVHDALIALDAAYDAGSGLIVIAGTGSVVLGRTTEGTLLRTGGWGHVLGDDGSGHAIGRAGLRAVAIAFDGGPSTTLCARVRDRFGIDDRESLLETVYRQDFNVQTVAPLVLDAAANGDAVASDLLSTQVQRLSEQVARLLNRDVPVAPRITLIGGMLRHDHYAECLHRCLQDRCADWSIGILQDEPVLGALRRARRQKQEAAG
jgi:N-acetylglucosamine kinase-like BadF-type ATPase